MNSFSAEMQRVSTASFGRVNFEVASSRVASEIAKKTFSYGGGGHRRDNYVKHVRTKSGRFVATKLIKNIRSEF